jgi:hypothetical protein
MAYYKPDPKWATLYRIGAWSAIAYVLIFITALVLTFVAPQPPERGGEAILRYIASNKTIYIAELLCWVWISFPAIFVFVAAGVALSVADRGWALFGGLVGVVSMITALSIGTSPPSLAGGLYILSGQYVGAPEPARASLISAADALAASTNAVSSAGILTAIGILALSCLMAKAKAAKGLALFGIVTGSIGIVLEAFRPLVWNFYIIYGIVLPIWYFAVGRWLAKSAKPALNEANDGGAPGMAGGRP